MEKPDFIALDASFEQILGSSSRIELLLEDSETPFFHEAGVYIASSRSVFITSNGRKDKDGEPFISIVKVTLSDEDVTYEVIQSDVVMANGAVNYQDGILFCEQGNKERAGGLVKMSLEPPHDTTTMVSDFHGVPFNSVNDVIIARDGAIWFTDPIYGFEQGFRNTPRLPSQVYRFDPRTSSIRAVADGFGRPNGLAFSPDEGTLYATVRSLRTLSLQVARLM